MKKLIGDRLGQAIDTILAATDDPGARSEIERALTVVGDAVSRVFTFFDGDAIEFRIVVDWTRDEGSVTRDDVARVARVAIAVGARPSYDGRPTALLLSAEPPSEDAERAALQNHVRILVATPVPAGTTSIGAIANARFAYPVPKISRFVVEAVSPRQLSAGDWNELYLSLAEDPASVRFVGLDGRPLASLAELEHALPAGFEAEHRQHTFPMSDAAVIRPNGELVPIQSVTFHYHVAWRGLGGDTYEAALASLVSAWAFG